MAGTVVTPASTGGGDQSLPPARPQAQAPAPPPPAPPQQSTLGLNNPLAGMTNIQPTATPSMHSNNAINEALLNAFRPVVPDQVNSLLGPAMGAIQARTPPIAFYQPRQAAPVPVSGKSS